MREYAVIIKCGPIEEVMGEENASFYKKASPWAFSHQYCYEVKIQSANTERSVTITRSEEKEDTLFEGDIVKDLVSCAFNEIRIDERLK